MTSTLGEFPEGAFAIPAVSIWRPPDSGNLWRRTGDVTLFEGLSFSPTFNAIGEWSMAMDYGSDQADLVVKNRLVTIDWRLLRSTWELEPHAASDPDTKQPLLEAAGGGAISILGWDLAWPDPTRPLNDQPVVVVTDPPTEPPLYKGPAEDVITDLVAGNLRDRRGMAIVVPPSQHRGTVVTASPTFDNLLELVTKLANLGGIGVDVGLVDVGGPGTTTAQLTLQIWEPADKTKSVILTDEASTIDSWDQTETAPTATEVIVAGGGPGGVDRQRQIVTTPESEAAADEWGGKRVVFADGTSTFDPEVLTQDGNQALLDGAGTRTLTLTSSEAPGQLAFYHFNRGDKATGKIAGGATVEDVITSLIVSVGGDASDEGITVEGTFGDPNANDSDQDLITQLAAMKQALRQLQQQRK